MKKVLALFLSVLMLFGSLSFAASADYSLDLESVREVRGLGNEVILSFDLNGGTIKGGVREYSPTTNTFSWNEAYLENMYYMIPETAGSQLPGDQVRLPSVTPPSGYVFNGWYCVETNATHPGNRIFTIPDDVSIAGSIVQLVADYSLAEPEEDEMAGVFNILVKVFGTIIGLLFLSDREEGAVEAGMQLMTDLLGSLFA